MNKAGSFTIIQIIRSGPYSLKPATVPLCSLCAEIAINKDLYANRASSDMSKSIFSIKSLLDHVFTVILTPANGECTLWKHSL